MQPISLLLLLLFGVAETFFGYRIFRLLVVIVGFLVGWAYTPALLAELTEGPVTEGGSLVAAIIGALIFGALAWLAFRLLVALYGFAVGYSLAVAAIGGPVAALLVAVVVAVLAYLITRPAIIGLTALNGAWITLGAALALLGRAEQAPPVFFVQPPDLPIDRPLLLALVLALAVVGAAVQWQQGPTTIGGPPSERAPRQREL